MSAPATGHTTEQMEQAALQRLSYFINRSAGQHRRAIAHQFAAARDATARPAQPTNPTPWSAHP